MSVPAHAALSADLLRRYPFLGGVVLPPLPETGRCGVDLCGETLADPASAPRGQWREPLTGTLIEILLCPKHQGD